MTTSSPKKVAVIVGTTRVNRIGPQIAEWVKTSLSSTPSEGFTLELLDIASFSLPIFNEPGPPAGIYDFSTITLEPMRKWNEAIASYDAYIFVTGEYNKGLPGPTKNAIDYLYQAWTGKPIAIVSYGIFGGSQASSNLVDFAGVQKLQVVEPRVMLEFPGRDPEKHNMSPSLMQAIQGKVVDEAWKAWEEKKGELEQAWGGLKAALVSPVAN